jgi:hypothetical protein
MGRGGAFGDVVLRTGANLRCPISMMWMALLAALSPPRFNLCRAVQTDRDFGKQIRGEILDDGPGHVVRAGNLVMQFEIAPRAAASVRISCIRVIDRNGSLILSGAQTIVICRAIRRA